MTGLPAPARRALLTVLLMGLTPGWIAAEQAEPPPDDPVGGFVYGAAPQGPMLSPDTLDGILEDLDLPDADGLSLWEQLLLWLEEYFSNSEADGLPDRLGDFRLSATVAQWIFYATCTLIVGLSAAIIVNEVRHSRRGSPRPAGEGRRENPGRLDAPDESVDDLPLTDRPAHVLNSLLRLLPLNHARGRTSSMTHREIRDVSSVLGPDQRQTLIDVAAVAERIRYAHVAPQTDEIRRVLTAAESLIDRLDGPR